jgi:hypothetical protein
LSGTTDTAVVVDPSGVLAIQDNGSSITVDASDLDVRDLTNASDSVLIYGNDGTNNRVILTDASGVLQVSAALSFVEATEVVATATALVGSTARDASTHPNGRSARMKPTGCWTVPAKWLRPTPPSPWSRTSSSSSPASRISPPPLVPTLRCS